MVYNRDTVARTGLLSYRHTEDKMAVGCGRGYRYGRLGGAGKYAYPDPETYTACSYGSRYRIAVAYDLARQTRSGKPRMDAIGLGFCKTDNAPACYRRGYGRLPARLDA